MKLLIFIFILKLLSSQEYLISNYNFTNQDYTIGRTYKFCKQFPNNPLTYSEIEQIIRHCHIYQIHPLIILSKMQLESDLVMRNSTNQSIIYLKHRAMGYGMAKNFRRDGKKFYIYGGYSLQIFNAVKRLRELFNEWKPGIKKYIVDLDKHIIPSNAATYALYRYTPFYSEHNVYNWKYKAVGNKGFVKIYKKFKTVWQSIK